MSMFDIMEGDRIAISEVKNKAMAASASKTDAVYILGMRTGMLRAAAFIDALPHSHDPMVSITREITADMLRKEAAND